tara:strand:- start:546 stop:800 length:255 start_codon:yes stop_codon:yes gene_type:complete
MSEEIMKRLSGEDLGVIVRISGKLGECSGFRVREYMDGVQCNWLKGNASIMWRSVGWDRDTVEWYELDGSEVEKRYEIEDLGSV